MEENAEKTNENSGEQALFLCEYNIERETETTEMQRDNIKPDPTHWTVN